MEDGVICHYGILGMKWGVRRTPEQLGHKKAAIGANKLQKYKDKQLSKIDRMYSKMIRGTEEAMEYDPDNKDLKKQLKQLNDLKKKDVEKIESMSYTDVVNEQKAASARRRETATKIAKSTVSAAAATALWGARMGLVGVKIYGVFKAGQVIGEFAQRGITWLNSPEGQEFISKGFNVVNTFVTGADKAAVLVNPNFEQYVDPQRIVDTAIEYGKAEAEKQLQSMTRR